MSQKSTQVALGGVFSALSLTSMFLTGLIPFTTYVLPALAGAMLIAVVEENGLKTAVLVYVSVSALSVFIVPDREAAMMFLAFFGYYPLVKGKLERIRLRALQYVFKLLLFNFAVVSGYLAIAHVFGVAELLEGTGDFGRYGVALFLGAGNVLFLMYDHLLTRLFFLYRYWFKRKFLRR